MSHTNIVIEDLRHGIIRTGALFALFNTLNNSDESVGDAAIESIVVLAQHGTLFFFVVVEKNSQSSSR